MKIPSKFRLATSILLMVFLMGQTSCVVYHKKDNGKHKGWYKNPKNPHHPNSTNPGKSNSEGKGKPSSKSKGNSNSKDKTNGNTNSNGKPNGKGK